MAWVKNTVFSSLEAGEGSPSSNEDRIENERTEEDLESGEVGKVGSDKDLDGVETNVGDLVADDDSEESTFDFGRSEVTPSLVCSYEELGFFPKGHGRAPGVETVPDPKGDEVVVFLDFFTTGLRFPCDVMLAEILDRFNVQFHLLTPNAFVQLSKFFWAVKTFGGDVNVLVCSFL